MIWQTARGALDLTARGVVMGIINVTPDSFSDGGKYFGPASAIEHALQMWEDGSAIIDIGGESTRPGAEVVDAIEERRRVVPVVAALVARLPGVMISVDTSKAEVARAALEAGAAIINDVTALRGDPKMGSVVAASHAGLVLMHMQGTPRTMQQAPTYGDVVGEVHSALEASVNTALATGIELDSIALDPGIGFGKSLEHNLALLRHLDAVRIGGRPLVVGVSRKSFLGKISGGGAMADRLWSTVGLTALLRSAGAQVLRVHDVRENVAALRAAEAVLGMP